MADAVTHIQKYEEPLEASTIAWNRLNDLKHEINCQKPCKVVAVDYTHNSVDVKILDMDADGSGTVGDYPIIPDVPIRQPLTSGSAYIILPVQVGDIGTIEFFDSSVDDIITQGRYSYSVDEDWHSLSDGLFTNGFLPHSKVITIDTSAKIVLGDINSTSTFKLSSNNTWTMVGNLNVTGDITATGTITGTTDVVGGGKSLKIHTHPYTDDGNPMNTGAPN